MASNETCSVYFVVYPDPSSSIYAILPFATVYVILFVLGLAGNSLLIYVTMKHKTLQTVQNIFILNLAASDIMMCLLSLPITPVTNIYKNWYFGELLCHLIPCVQGVSIFICTFSLGAIAVDRYILVVRPHARPLTKYGASIATLILWTLSIIVTLPYAFNMEMVEYNFKDLHICGQFCTERWPSPISRRLYTMVVMFSQFVVPFTCMAFCYAHIFLVLHKRAKVKLRKMDERSMALEQSLISRTHRESSLEPKINGREDSMNSFFDKQEKDRQRLIAQNRRTTSILVTMVVWFGLTWLPHNVVSLIIEYDESQIFRLFDRDDLDISYLLNLFTHCFAMSNNVVNPVLYAWLNPSFRQLVISTCFGTGVTKKVNGGHRIVSQYQNLPSRSLEMTAVTKTEIPQNHAIASPMLNTPASPAERSSSPSIGKHTIIQNGCAENESLLIEFNDSDIFV